jgi:hypothetical protein
MFYGELEKDLADFTVKDTGLAHIVNVLSSQITSDDPAEQLEQLETFMESDLGQTIASEIKTYGINFAHGIVQSRDLLHNNLSPKVEEIQTRITKQVNESLVKQGYADSSSEIPAPSEFYWDAVEAFTKTSDMKSHINAYNGSEDVSKEPNVRSYMNQYTLGLLNKFKSFEVTESMLNNMLTANSKKETPINMEERDLAAFTRIITNPHAFHDTIKMGVDALALPGTEKLRELTHTILIISKGIDFFREHMNLIEKEVPDNTVGDQLYSAMDLGIGLTGVLYKARKQYKNILLLDADTVNSDALPKYLKDGGTEDILTKYSYSITASNTRLPLTGVKAETVLKHGAKVSEKLDKKMAERSASMKSKAVLNTRVEFSRVCDELVAAYSESLDVDKNTSEYRMKMRDIRQTVESLQNSINSRSVENQLYKLFTATSKESSELTELMIDKYTNFGRELAGEDVEWVDSRVVTMTCCDFITNNS